MAPNLDKNIQIIRSPRFRNLTARVTTHGKIRVHAPWYITKGKIFRFLEQHEEALFKEVEAIKKSNQIEIINGMDLVFPLLNDEISFSIAIGLRKKNQILRRDANQFEVLLPEGDKEFLNLRLKSVLHQFYRDEARTFFHQRCSEYADQIDVEFNRIRIGEQISRWGSCSEKKNLNFNFRLMLAPFFVADYVAAHEVLHLKVKNHSQIYWRDLETLYPRQREAKEWLKLNGKNLWKYF